LRKAGIASTPRVTSCGGAAGVDNVLSIT
jgi:hypothetical protein